MTALLVPIEGLLPTVRQKKKFRVCKNKDRRAFLHFAGTHKKWSKREKVYQHHAFMRQYDFSIYTK